MEITKESFLSTLEKIACSETSTDPHRWSKENKLWGHCAVFSLLAQDYFKGVIMRGSLENTKYAHLQSHYWNKLPNGEEVDFTSIQYSDISIQDLHGEERSRERVILYPDTTRRYETLKERFECSLENSANNLSPQSSC